MGTPSDMERFRPVGHTLPSDLEHMAPGPVLAAMLAGVDRSRLSDHDVVRLLVARDRVVSHLQAERARDVAEVAARCGDDEFAPLEVGAALRLTRSAATHEVAFALEIAERLPQVGELLRSGRIDVRRAKALVEGTAHLPRSTARALVAEIADRASDLTTGQLRAWVRKRCAAADAEDAARRIRHAVEGRRVILEAAPDGTANLYLLDLPPDLAAAARNHIEGLARSQAADGRTMDQRRADAALDLLGGRGPSGAGGAVDITVDLRTLLGLADAPGDLGGWGPVVADIARQVVDRQVQCRWQATVVDDGGDPLAVAVRRRPTSSQARQVRTRDRTCVFPGCRRPSRRSDVDHITRHSDGGPTRESNLAPLCRFHHRAKDESAWNYAHRSEGGYTWTSPFGHTYVSGARSP